MEREPDYEDELLRMWKARPEDNGVEDDPTVLHVDVTKEEPYESRLYLPKRDERSIVRLIRVLRGSEVGRPLPLSDAGLLAHQFLLDGVVKLLSKRTKASGEIDLLVVASVMGYRLLLHPEERFTEAGYRTKVTEFETRWVDGGPLGRGPVVGPTDWKGFPPS